MKDIDFCQVAAGEHFSLALSQDRLQLYSFGRSDVGQLGIGFIPERLACELIPRRVKFPQLKRIISIGAGLLHALALTEDDELYSWGSNESCANGHPMLHKDVDTYRPKLLDLSNIKLNIGGNDDEGYCCRPVQFTNCCGAIHSLVLAQPMKK